MEDTQPQLYRDGLGTVHALMYDGRNMQALNSWLAASGERGRIEECIDPADPFAFFGSYILVITIEGMAPIVLRPGDWLIECDCSERFHSCPADLFTTRFLPALQEATVAEAQPEPDRYQRTNAQVVADLQDWSRQNIGHYGNEKPEDVLRRAYMDALELALFLREKIDEQLPAAVGRRV